MIKKIQYTILLFGLLLAISSCSPKVRYPIELPKQNIAMDIITLSSDDMEGREIGTEGERKAADYIASRFGALGLRPMGDDNTYFQHFSRKKNKNPHGDDSGEGEVVVGKNVIGLIDNKAATTVVIGGHYDHLGYGSEGSLHTGELAIHNGADDNSSGVAGVLFLAESIKKAGLKHHNYLFICFSGEEKGLWGSNYFINHSIDKPSFHYMINMDMIGRLNKERKLSISGIGTSPHFESIIDGVTSPKFSIKKDLSGLGPSDHASFYNAGVPVLAFFTGQHSDYHKPTDDFEHINYDGIIDIVQYIYQVVSTLEDHKEKLTFVKTKDESQAKMSFSVTLGVMPDYLFDGQGMKIDGTKDGKPAQLAGLQKGDIVIKMGNLDVIDMQSYMKCLSAFKPGQTVEVMAIRDGKKITKQVTF